MTTMSSTEYSQLLRFLGVVGNNENLEMYTSSDNSGSSGKRRRNSIKTLYIASNRADDHRRKSITIISIVTSSTSTVKKRERERERGNAREAIKIYKGKRRIEKEEDNKNNYTVTIN
tara:strand:+ start:153 stop:503 length:351 start_codon:yes stop_codon:yes gene_type:complete